MARMELVRDEKDRETYYMNVGPQHPSTHGVFRLKITLDGEIVQDADMLIGYLHRSMEKLAEERGWTIRAVDPARGRMEATAYASYIRFEDEVVLRARPDGADRTLIDMRSVSRVGIGDLGVNAQRIHDFLEDLAAVR